MGKLLKIYKLKSKIFNKNLKINYCYDKKTTPKIFLKEVC